MEDLRRLFDEILNGYNWAYGFAIQEGMGSYDNYSELEKAINNYKERLENIIKEIDNE